MDELKTLYESAKIYREVLAKGKNVSVGTIRGTIRVKVIKSMQ